MLYTSIETGNVIVSWSKEARLPKTEIKTGFSQNVSTLKKIAYIEIDTHAEIAQAFMEIMEGLPSFSIDYYLSEKIKAQITDHGEQVFLSDSSMILDQLKGKNYDLIIIGTVHRYFNTFDVMAAKYHTAVIVHNMNFTKASPVKLVKSIFKKDRIYRLKLLGKEGLLRSLDVYQKAKHKLVLDEELSSDEFRFLPIFYTGQIVKTENKDLNIVIPGGVSQKRRNYGHVFEVIKNLKTEKPVAFIFLGKAKGKELEQLKILSQSVPQNIRLEYFSERVSSSVFDEWMQKADVLWCPIQQETEFFGLREIYGRTKMTGNLGDAIKFGKWAVFPESYPSKLDFIVPEQKNIISQFDMLKNTSIDFYKDYSRQVVQQKLERLLNELMVI